MRPADSRFGRVADSDERRVENAMADASGPGGMIRSPGAPERGEGSVSEMFRV